MSIMYDLCVIYGGNKNDIRSVERNMDVCLRILECGLALIEPNRTRTNCPYAATFWDICSISPPIYIHNTYTYTNIYTYLSLCRKREREKDGGGGREGEGEGGRAHLALTIFTLIHSSGS